MLVLLLAFGATATHAAAATTASPTGTASTVATAARLLQPFRLKRQLRLQHCHFLIDSEALIARTIYRVVKGQVVVQS